MTPTDPSDKPSLIDIILKLAGAISAIAGLAAVLLPDVSAKLVLGAIAVLVLIVYVGHRANLETAAFSLVAVLLILAAAYTVVVRPITVTGTLARADGSPVGDADLVLTDGDGVPHNIQTGDDGGFTVNNLPQGAYEVAWGDQVLYSGEVPGGWQRFLTLNIVRIGNIYVTVLAPEPTPTPTPALTAAPTEAAVWCADWPACEVLPQVEGTGGSVFYWNNPPGSLTYGLAPDCAHSGAFGLQLEYGFTDPGNGGWIVSWNPSPRGSLDVSGFTYLEFWIRGRAGGETVAVGLKDDQGREIKVHTRENLGIRISSTDWAPIRIPLSTFSVQVNLVELENVSFGFDARDGAGVLCLDDVAFTE